MEPFLFNLVEIEVLLRNPLKRVSLVRIELQDPQVSTCEQSYLLFSKFQGNLPTCQIISLDSLFHLFKNDLILAVSVLLNDVRDNRDETAGELAQDEQTVEEFLIDIGH